MSNRFDIFELFSIYSNISDKGQIKIDYIEKALDAIKRLPGAEQDFRKIVKHLIGGKFGSLTTSNKRMPDGVLLDKDLDEVTSRMLTVMEPVKNVANIYKASYSKVNAEDRKTIEHFFGNIEAVNRTIKVVKELQSQINTINVATADKSVLAAFTNNRGSLKKVGIINRGATEGAMNDEHLLISPKLISTDLVDNKTNMTNLIFHEIGHALDRNLNLKTDPEIGPLLDNLVEEAKIKIPPLIQDQPEEFKRYVQSYGEIFARTFAAELSPRASRSKYSTAKVLMETLKKRGFISSALIRRLEAMADSLESYRMGSNLLKFKAGSGTALYDEGYAGGGYTRAGAHYIKVGEKGQEYIIPNHMVQDLEKVLGGRITISGLKQLVDSGQYMLNRRSRQLMPGIGSSTGESVQPLSGTYSKDKEIAVKRTKANVYLNQARNLGYTSTQLKNLEKSLMAAENVTQVGDAWLDQIMQSRLKESTVRVADPSEGKRIPNAAKKIMSTSLDAGLNTAQILQQLDAELRPGHGITEHDIETFRKNVAPTPEDTATTTKGILAALGGVSETPAQSATTKATKERKKRNIENVSKPSSTSAASILKALGETPEDKGEAISVPVELPKIPTEPPPAAEAALKKEAEKTKSKAQLYREKLYEQMKALGYNDAEIAEMRKSIWRMSIKQMEREVPRHLYREGAEKIDPTEQAVKKTVEKVSKTEKKKKYTEAVLDPTKKVVADILSKLPQDMPITPPVPVAELENIQKVVEEKKKKSAALPLQDPYGPNRRTKAGAALRKKFDEFLLQPDNFGKNRDDLYNAFFNDPLTGLMGGNAYKRDIIGKKPGIFGSADVSGLKTVNDKYGHAAGDAFLQEVAKVFKGSGLDVYRTGGDEFRILGQAGSEAELKKKLRAVQAKIRSLKLKITDNVGAEKTLTGFNLDAELSDTFNKADAAMKKAKDERKTALKSKYPNLYGDVVDPRNINTVIELQAAQQKTRKQAPVTPPALPTPQPPAALPPPPTPQPATGGGGTSGGGSGSSGGSGGGGNQPPRRNQGIPFSGPPPSSGGGGTGGSGSGGGGGGGGTPPQQPSGTPLGGKGKSGKKTRAELMQEQLNAISGDEILKEALNKLGLELKDLKLKSINYVKNLSTQIETLSLSNIGPLGQVSRVDIARDLRTGQIGSLADIREQRSRLLRKDRKSAIEDEEQELLRQQMSELRGKYPRVFEQLYQEAPQFIDPRGKLKLRTREYGQLRRFEFGLTDKETGETFTKRITTDLQGNTIPEAAQRVGRLTDSIARNTKEVLSWTLAVGLIYTPLQKLQDLVATSIKNQTLLANTLVTVGKSQEYAGKIFDDALNIATQTGVAVGGVIEGYNLALRATGDASTEAKRFTDANELLKNSISLSKLAMIDQASATDILVASLKQMGKPMEYGSVLLDKWVRVAQIANVDVNTLATSFGIVAEAATNAGLNIDELNGLIATVAQSGITSAKETGNAVRAIIAGVSTDQATKELQQFGIAVTDVSGKARPFKDIITDIKVASDVGLINKDDLTRISLAIGQGNRRAPQVLNSILGIGTISNVASESAKAEGEAARALAVQMNTVETSIVKLSNSFVKLAQILGTDGGILSATQGAIEVLTGLVDILGTVGKFLGGGLVIPAVVGLGKMAGLRDNIYNFGYSAQEAIYARRNRKDINAAGDLMYWDNPQEFSSQKAARAAARSQTLNIPANRAMFESGANKFAGYASAGLTTLAYAAPYLAEGDMGSAAATAGASMAGAAVSTLLGAGPTLGAVIGGAIAEVIVGIIDRKIQDIRNNTESSSAGEPGPEAFNYKKAFAGLTEAEKIDVLSVTGGAELYNQDQLDYAKRAGKWRMDTAALFAPKDTNIYDLALEQSQKGFEGLNPREVRRNLGNITPGRITSTEELRNLMGVSTEETFKPEVSKYFAPLLEATKNDELLTRIQLESKDYLKSLTSPNADTKITIAEYNRRVQGVEGYGSSLTNLVATGATNQFANLPKDMRDVSSAFEEFANIFTKGSPEAKVELVQLGTEIASLFEKISSAENVGLSEVSIRPGEAPITIEKARELLATRQEQLGTAVAMERYNIATRTPIRDTTSMEKISSSYLPRILEKANEYMQKQYEALENVNPDESLAAKARDSSNKFLIKFKDGFENLEGYSNEAISAAYDFLKKTGELKEIADTAGFSTYKDYTPDQLRAAAQQASAYDMQLRKFAEENDTTYSGEISSEIIEASDKSLLFLTTNFALFQKFLEEISNNTKKMVDGMYNLPDGASFWVPYSAVSSYYNKNTDIASTPAGTTGKTTPTSTPTSDAEAYAKQLANTYNATAWSANPATAQQMPEYLKNMIGTYTSSAWTGTPPPANLTNSNDFLDAGTNLRAKGPGDITRILKENYGLATGIYNPSYMGSPSDFYDPRVTKPVHQPGMLPDTKQQLQPVNTRLNVDVRSNITLTLDGRVLWNAIKQYATSDLVKFTNGATSSSKAVII